MAQTITGWIYSLERQQRRGSKESADDDCTTNVIQRHAKDGTAGDLWTNEWSRGWVCARVCPPASRNMYLPPAKQFFPQKKRRTFLTWSVWHGVGLTSEPLIWHSYGNFRAPFFRFTFRNLVEIFFVPPLLTTIDEQFEQSKNVLVYFLRLFCTFLPFSSLHRVLSSYIRGRAMSSYTYSWVIQYLSGRWRFLLFYCAYLHTWTSLNFWQINFQGSIEINSS